MCIPGSPRNSKRWQQPSSNILPMNSKAETREPIDRRLHNTTWPGRWSYGAPDQEKPQNGSLGKWLPAEVAVDNPPDVTTHSLQQDAALNARLRHHKVQFVWDRQGSCLLALRFWEGPTSQSRRYLLCAPAAVASQPPILADERWSYSTVALPTSIR